MDRLAAEFVNRLDEGNAQEAARLACEVTERMAERDQVNYAECLPVAYDRLIEVLQDHCLWIWKPGREDYREKFMEAVADGMTLYLNSDHPAKMQMLEEFSCGQKMLREVVTKALPDYEVRDEEPIGNLFMDIFIPELNLCFEFDGRQHYEFVPVFHATVDDLYRQQANDKRKEELCLEKGIRLIRIRHDEPITVQTVIEKMLKKGA